MTGTLHAVEDVREIAFVIGIDPGPVPGFCVLNLTLTPGRDGWADIYQCNSRTAPWLLARLCGPDGAGGARCLAAMEPFTPGHSPGARMRPGRITADLAGELAADLDGYGIPCAAQRNALVKPWATDRRLDACGLLELTRGSAHARSAAGQALYCAVQSCGYPDPLSRKARA